MLFMKKLAKCSAAITISASGRGSRIESPRRWSSACSASLSAGIGTRGAAGDARGVAADAGEDEAHTPATFSSTEVVIA